MAKVKNLQEDIKYAVQRGGGRGGGGVYLYLQDLEAWG